MRIPTPRLDRLTGDLRSPLVTVPGDGSCAVTFVWRGDSEPSLMVNRLGEQAMERMPGTDVGHLTYRLKSDHRGSYRIDGGPDPLNARRIPGRWGAPGWSVFELPDAPRDRWERRAEVPRGTVERQDGVSVYLPATELTESLPVVVLLDGDMWFGGLGFQNRLDSMIAEGVVPAMVVVAPEAADNATRWHDLTANDDYVDQLADEVLGKAAWPITADPDRTVIAGQSLGGLTALYAGLRRPDRFGRVVAQSPSLWWRPGLPPTVPRTPVEGVPWLVERFAGAPGVPRAVHLDVGSHEGAMAGYSRELYEVLRGRGGAVSLDEFTGGHDYACWRVALGDALVRIFRSS